jgi:hypothetical protein
MKVFKAGVKEKGAGKAALKGNADAGRRVPGAVFFNIPPFIEVKTGREVR